jgi:ribonuclease H / adenosylcobalamin/alpha-ribazole phosphatase
VEAGELRLHEQHGVPTIDVLLIRHGSLDDGDAVLWGRTPGVVLSRRGHREMSRLADALAPAGVRSIVSSPQLRTLESAGVLARALGASIDVDADADEFDFGQWTGHRFDELQQDDRWRRFNEHRSNASAPHGESVTCFQARIRRLIDRRLAGGDAPACVVTHAEVIRMLILDSLGLDADAWQTISIAPASVTALQGVRKPLRIMALGLDAAGIADTLWESSERATTNDTPLPPHAPIVPRA